MGALVTVFWNSRERRLRAPWRIALLPLFIAALAFAPVAGLAGWLEAKYAAGVWLAGESPAMFDKVMDFIVSPLFSILIIASVIIAARIVDRRDPRDLGLRIDGAWWSEFRFGLLLGAAMIVFIFAAEATLGWVVVAPRAAPGIIGVPIWMLWAFIVMKVFCIGAYEEIVSRGGLLKNAAEGFRAVFPPAVAAFLAAVATSFVFSLLHATTDNFSMASFFGLALNGMLLAAPVLLTGRLGMSIGMHITWNFTQGALFGYPVSGDVENISLLVIRDTGPAAWTGGSYGPEAGYLAAIAMIFGFVAITAFVARSAGRVAILPQIAEFRARN